MIQFDEHIFQMGWNHELGYAYPWKSKDHEFNSLLEKTIIL